MNNNQSPINDIRDRINDLLLFEDRQFLHILWDAVPEIMFVDLDFTLKMNSDGYWRYLPARNSTRDYWHPYARESLAATDRGKFNNPAMDFVKFIESKRDK